MTLIRWCGIAGRHSQKVITGFYLTRNMASKHVHTLDCCLYIKDWLEGNRTDPQVSSFYKCLITAVNTDMVNAEASHHT